MCSRRWNDEDRGVRKTGARHGRAAARPRDRHGHPRGRGLDFEPLRRLRAGGGRAPERAAGRGDHRTEHGRPLGAGDASAGAGRGRGPGGPAFRARLCRGGHAGHGAGACPCHPQTRRGRPGALRPHGHGRRHRAGGADAGGDAGRPARGGRLPR